MKKDTACPEIGVLEERDRESAVDSCRTPLQKPSCRNRAMLLIRWKVVEGFLVKGENVHY